MDSEWMVRARCRGEDPATFFPPDSLGVDAARRICHPCEVRRECLAYALSEGLNHGVFGGCSERQRERLRRSDYGEYVLARVQERHELAHGGATA